MNRTMNYRRLLLKAVNLFLEQTPKAQARALRIVRQCSHAIIPFSLNSIVWGGKLSALSDVVYYENGPYLLNLRDTLLGKSSTRARTYVNYDFRDELTPNEARWLAQGQELLAFLHQFPMMRTDPAEAALQTYQRLAGELQTIMGAESSMGLWGDETIYHLVLREVAEIVTHINLELSMQHFGYLIPQTPYSTVSEEANYPHVAETLTWAQKALDAINGKAWLLVTWQITPDQVHLSFH